MRIRQALRGAIERDDTKDGRPGTRTSSRNGVCYLFNCWPQVVQRIRSAGQIALFIDFDGTLTPLRPRPEDVPPLDLATRALLGGLASRRRLGVYVISGRRLADLKRLIHVPGVRLFGMYGWEGTGAHPLRKERRLVQRAKRLIRTRLSKMTSIRLEDKSLGLAVHYRGAPPDEVRLARTIVREALEDFEPQLWLQDGNKVWELLHRVVRGKGSAVRRLLGKRSRPTLPIFVGDDASDESAFAALPHGITLRVGETHRTQARFFLRNAGEVLTFLERLAAETCVSGSLK